MKICISLLTACGVLAGCAAQSEKPEMQDAQYRAIARSSTLSDQCAIAGMMDVDLAAAGSQALEERAAEFQYDPARLRSERQRAVIELEQEGALKQPACNALAYEVLRVQAVRKPENDAEVERKRAELHRLKVQQGGTAP